MSHMTLQNMAPLRGFSLGQITIESPSGHVAHLTVEEEIALTKRALEERVLRRLNLDLERKEALIQGGIGAAGAAVGITVGGLLLGWILGKSKSKSPLSA